MTDRDLIEKVEKAYGAKDLKVLSEIIDMSHVTLTKWKTRNSIPKNGTGRQYLELLLKVKQKYEPYEKLGTAITEFMNCQKDNQEAKEDS